MRVILRVCFICIVQCCVVPSWTQMINTTFVSTHANPQFSDVIDETLPLKAVATYCPGVKGCYTDVPEHPTYDVNGQLINNTNCCLQCRCDTLCFVRGDCCFDLALNKTASDAVSASTLMAGCTKTMIPDSKSAFHAFQNNYMLINKCALTHFNASVRRKCEYPNTNKISEMTPYTYTLNKASYRNIWCYRCNMFSVKPALFAPWEMQINCPQYFGVKSLLRNNVTYNEHNFLDNIVTDNCTAVWHPPLHYSVDACYPDIISECVSSDDQTLVDLCENLDSVFAPFKGDTLLFKNIYCAACNGEIIAVPHFHLMLRCQDHTKQTEVLSILTVMISLDFLSQTLSSPWLVSTDARTTTTAGNSDETYVTELVGRTFTNSFTS